MFRALKRHAGFQAEARCGLRLDAENAAERLDAFAHSDQAEAMPDCLELCAAAIVLQGEAQQRGRANEVQFHRYVTGLGMAHDIGQAFLGHAIKCDGNRFVDILRKLADTECEAHRRQSLAPSHQVVFERTDEAQFVEGDGTQATRHGLHHTVDPIRQLDHVQRCAMKRRQGAAAGIADAYGFDLDRIQGLPELVVKFMCEEAPLGFLRPNHPARKITQFNLFELQRRFEIQPLFEFAQHLPPAAPGEPCQAKAERQQRQRQFVELKVLELLLGSHQALAELGIDADQEGRNRQQTDKGEVGSGL